MKMFFVKWTKESHADSETNEAAFVMMARKWILPFFVSAESGTSSPTGTYVENIHLSHGWLEVRKYGLSSHSRK